MISAHVLDWSTSNPVFESEKKQTLKRFVKSKVIRVIWYLRLRWWWCGVVRGGEGGVDGLMVAKLRKMQNKLKTKRQNSTRSLAGRVCSAGPSIQGTSPWAGKETFQRIQTFLSKLSPSCPLLFQIYYLVSCWNFENTSISWFKKKYRYLSCCVSVIKYYNFVSLN